MFVDILESTPIACGATNLLDCGGIGFLDDLLHAWGDVEHDGVVDLTRDERFWKRSVQPWQPGGQPMLDGKHGVGCDGLDWKIDNGGSMSHRSPDECPTVTEDRKHDP